MDGTPKEGAPAAQELIELSAYETPELPTEERLNALFAHLKATFFPDKSSDAIAAERLETPALRRLDAAARPPASGPVVDEIARTVDAWAREANPAMPVLAVVLPPGEETDIIRHWAERDGHFIMAAPPERGGHVDLAHLNGIEPTRLIVIPKLEQWFLRTPEGLQGVRHLLALLDSRQQRAVIGCNSFAWAFLSKAVGIENIAGKAMTFRPFDADRLQSWLNGLAEEELDRGIRFRLVADGSEVFSGESRKETREFFLRLAGYSRGIPWVAWQMWRNTLRIGDENHLEVAERHGFWVSSLEEFVLPGDYPRELLFALHAIALHGELSPAELGRVLPEGVDTSTVATLAASRLVRRENGRLSLQPEAYPAVRSGFLSSGFPVGAI